MSSLASNVKLKLKDVHSMSVFLWPQKLCPNPRVPGSLQQSCAVSGGWCMTGARVLGQRNTLND